MIEHTTPLDREILTHYWVSPEPFLKGSENWTQTHHDIVNKFLGLGLLRHEDDGTGFHRIRANPEALKPYMDALAAVPLPVKKWLIPAANGDAPR